MAIVTRPRREVKSTRKAHAFSLALAIDHVVYTVEPIPAGEFGTKAFRLVKKSDGAVYDVVRTHDGLVECDCPDYEMRHKGVDCGCCKHGNALVAMGLIDAPAPVTKAEAPAVEPANTEVEPVVEPCCPPDEVEPCSACLGSVVHAQDAASDEPASSVVTTEQPAEAETAIEPTATEAKPTPAVEDVRPARPSLLTLDELIDAEAARLRRMETFAGDLMARTLAELARTVRSVQARSPLDLDDEVPPRRPAHRPIPSRSASDLSDDFTGGFIGHRDCN